MEIQSPKNPRVKAWAALKEARARRELGLFLVEGPREVQRALEAGLEPEALLLGPKADLEALGPLPPERLYRLSEEALARVSARENPAPLLGVFRIPHRPWPPKLPQDPLVLALIGVEKPGNLGAILRTALAAGVSLVLVGEGTDPYAPQAVRNSTGAVFRLPVYPLKEEEMAAYLEGLGLPLVAATPRGEALYWEGGYRKGAVFLLGAEDQGLPEAWLRRAHLRVRIPMGEGVDSLNVSVSAALLLYEALRQRMGA